MPISEHIETIKAKAAEMDVLIAQFRVMRATIDAAEAAIRKARPLSEPSRIYQERLALLALDAMARPTSAGEVTMASIADTAWKGVA